MIFVFGIKGGVGAERLSEFFHRVRLDRHVGSSPTALRNLRRQLEEVIVSYQAAQQNERRSSEQRVEIGAGADETFFDQVILVLMDLSSGYIVLEEPAADRSYKTWQGRVQQALEPLGITLRYIVSDRAKALVKLALDGFQCPSMPDVFHALRDLAKVVGVSFHLKPARLEDKRIQAQRTLSGLQAKGKHTGAQERFIGHLDEQIATLRADQTQAQQGLEEASYAVHPFALGDSSRQQATQVEAALSQAFRGAQDSAHPPYGSGQYQSGGEIYPSDIGFGRLGGCLVAVGRAELTVRGLGGEPPGLVAGAIVAHRLLAGAGRKNQNAGAQKRLSGGVQARSRGLAPTLAHRGFEREDFRPLAGLGH